MLHSLCNKKGMGMVEVLIAIFLTAVGILALLSLQSTGWKTIAKSDYMGRASGILYRTLENYEARIMNPCNSITLGAQPSPPVLVSDQSTAISGDMTYTVNTTIIQDGSNPQAFVVTVNVTWATSTMGVSESMTVTRQERNRFGC
jgi:Tfp pilus assembly protein PilV